MKKFRASFTVLSQWANGRWEEAIKSYYHLERVETPQMKLGKELHKQWADEVRRTGKLPKVFGGEPITPIFIEEYFRVDVNEWLQLSFVADLVIEENGGTVIDYKTSSSKTSGEMIDTYQLPMYEIGLMLVGVLTRMGKILHYDPITKQVDQSMVWFSDNLRKETLEWIITNASEMHDYIQKNNLDQLFVSSKGRVGFAGGEPYPLLRGRGDGKEEN